MHTLLTKNPFVQKNAVYAIALIVCVIGGFYLLTCNLRPVSDPAEFLPQETLAVLKVKNFAKTATDFKNSPFGQELTDPSLEMTLDQLAVDAELKHDLLTAIGFFEQAVEHPLFNAVLRKKSALAVLPPTAPYDSEEAFLKKNLVAITQIKVPFFMPVTPDTLLAKAIPSEVEVNKSSYKGTVITALELEDQGTVYYGLIDHTLIWALEKHPVERCIELAKNRLLRSGITLHQNKAYRELLDDTDPNPDILLYIHLPKASRVLHGFDQSFPPGSTLDKEERFLISSSINKEHHQVRAVLKNYRQRASNKIDHFQLAGPTQDTHLKNVPDGAAIYFWTNLLDFSSLWRATSIAPDLDTATIMFYIAQKIYEHTGTDIYSFLDLFGAEFGFYIQDIHKQPFTTFPMVCFQIQLRDPEGLEQLLGTLLEHVPTHTTQLNKTTQAVSLIMAGGLIQPAYAIAGNWFFLADNIGQLEQFFARDSAHLVTHKSFKQVNNKVQKKNNLLLYARIDKVNQGLRKLFLWGIETMVHTQKLSNVQGELLTQRVVLPVFDGLSGVEAQGIRIRTEQDDVMLELELYTPQTN